MLMTLQLCFGDVLPVGLQRLPTPEDTANGQVNDAMSVQAVFEQADGQTANNARRRFL